MSPSLTINFLRGKLPPRFLPWARQKKSADTTSEASDTARALPHPASPQLPLSSAMVAVLSRPKPMGETSSQHSLPSTVVLDRELESFDPSPAIASIPTSPVSSFRSSISLPSIPSLHRSEEQIDFPDMDMEEINTRLLIVQAQLAKHEIKLGEAQNAVASLLDEQFEWTAEERQSDRRYYHILDVISRTRLYIFFLHKQHVLLREMADAKGGEVGNSLGPLK